VLFCGIRSGFIRVEGGVIMKKSDQHSALTAFSQGLFSGILILLLSALALSNPAYAANLSLSRTSLTLVYKTGNDLSGYGTLKVNGTSASPSWTSSDNTVAVVRKTSGSYARVWPKREGTCTITASVNGRKLRCRVTVVSKDAGMSVPAKKRIPSAPMFSTAGVKEYTFTDTIINGSKKDGDYVWKVCSGDEPKIIHLRGHIYLNWEGNDKIMKIVVQFVVTIANYVFAKLFVFKKGQRVAKEEQKPEE
jgi:hypothetical protein